MVNSPYPEGINQLALRISTYEYPLGALLAIYFLSATGHMPSKFRLDHWIKAVQWHGESKVAAFVNTEDEWADAQTLLTPLENILVEADSKQGSVVWSSTQKDHPAIPKDSLPLKLFVRPENDIQRHLPATLHVEATGLAGTFQLERTKKGSRYTGPRFHPWKKLWLSVAALEAQRPCRSLRWAGAKQPMNSWCFTTLPWTVPNIGMRY